MFAKRDCGNTMKHRTEELMKDEKMKRLKALGWVEESVSEFLGLTPEEEALIEVRLLLSQLLKKERISNNITQEALAKRIHSSQSRVAKMESSDAGVSFELLFKALFATGVTPKKVGKALAQVG